MPRHASTHAAGILITEQPVTEYVPLQRNDECVTTQFPMLLIEELGLLKMDFLGLRTLTVIHDTVEAVREGRGVELDMDRIDLNDPDVYKMICEGDTVAIFQLESGGMTQFMKEMQPGGIEDLIAGGALFRPGPMESIPRYVNAKRNRATVRYDDPKLEPILDVTYGCIVYQEQVLQIVREIAGYSYGQADLLRRAMSKKKHDVMENERNNFIYGVTGSDGTVLVPGAVRNGVPEDVAKKIFDDMSDFASYGFNKSHSAAYAILIYQTAWLKRRYPVEFMSATLNSCMGFSDKVAHYIDQCRQNKIAVLPPDINLSLSKFSVVGDELRFGLAAVKNIGHGAVKAIINERRSQGAFGSFTDFIRRIGATALNKRGIESLIRCGAFDSMKYTRSSLLNNFERLLDGIVNARRNEMEGQINFLADGGNYPAVSGGNANKNTDAASENIPAMQEFPHSALLNMEKEILGLYVSGHPLDGYSPIITDVVNCDTRGFRQSEDNYTENGGAEDDGENGYALKDGQYAVLGGIITKVKTKYTKSNALMAFVDLEDMYGSVEMLVFPKVYERLEKKLREERIVLAKGKISAREDEDAKFLCDDVFEIKAAPPEGGTAPMDYNGLRQWARPGYKAGTEYDGARAPIDNNAPVGYDNTDAKKLYIRISGAESRPQLDAAYATLSYFSGHTPVVLYNRTKNATKELAKEYWVKPSDTLIAEMRERFGADNIAMR